MKYKLCIIFFIIFSCTSNYTRLDVKDPYNAKGFAHIFNETDYENKIIKGKLDNEILQVSHNKLRPNSLIKIINPDNNKSIVIKTYRRINYPDFYKILISRKVAEKIELDPTLPLVEIIELKKNKSFVAKKAKIFKEEKKISSNAPVTSVQIANISKKKKDNQKKL